MDKLGGDAREESVLVTIPVACATLSWVSYDMFFTFWGNNRVLSSFFFALCGGDFDLVMQITILQCCGN